MSVSPRIAGGHVRWNCKHLHEDWCEEPGHNSKNDSFAWTKGDHPHDFHVAKWSLFRKYSWFCSHSNPKLFRRLPHEGFSQGGQSDHCCADRNIDWCWPSPSLQNPCGAQGLFVNLVQNIFAHKGEGSLPLEHSQDPSNTNSLRRTISDCVCGDSAAKDAKETEYM